METETVLKLNIEKFPKLRFKDFNDNWQKIKIQKLIDDNFIISHLDGNHGALYPRSEEFSLNGIPYISANDFVSGTLSFKNCKYLPIERAEKFKKGVAKNGDVLFAHNATVGPVAILETQQAYVILSTTATYFRCNSERLNNYFLKFLLSSRDFVKQYSKVMSQSTRNQVPITIQRKFTLNLPLILEQNKIASFLSSVDKKIQQLTRKKELFESLKKGVMQQLFAQEIRFKNENGKDFPTWEKRSLGEIALFSKGKGISKNDIEMGGITQCIRYGELYTHYNETIDITVSRTNLPFKELVLSEAGDVIIPASGETRIDIATSSCVLNEGIALGGDLNIIRGDFNGVFIAYYLNDHLKTKIANLSQGSSVMHLYAAQLRKLKLEIPSIQEQQKIADFLSAIDKKIEAVLQQIEKTQSFKKGLLQQMFI